MPDRFTQADIERAVLLRKRGMTWREIGIEVAESKGRLIRYQGTSIAAAARPFLQETTAHD